MNTCCEDCAFLGMAGGDCKCHQEKPKVGADSSIKSRYTVPPNIIVVGNGSQEKSTHESNFRDVNCPKCGNRNTVIPPHDCKPTHEIGWEERRENENPVIKQFRQDNNEVLINMFIASKSDWPAHQMARVLFNFKEQTLTHHKESIISKLEGKSVAVKKHAGKSWCPQCEDKGYNEALAEAIDVVKAAA